MRVTMDSKLFALFLLVLASTSCLVTSQKSKSAGDAELENRVKQLLDLSYKKPVIRLNGQKFKEFVRSAPRNYSMVVMFTALSASRGCTICKAASDEFAIVANSHRYAVHAEGDLDGGSKLFLAMVDFDEGPDVFQLMKLQTAPVFMHFPAKGKPKKMDTMDVQRVGFGADAIAKWINERTNVNIRIFRPPNYTGTLVLFLLFCLVAGLLYLRRHNLQFLHNKPAWGVLALLFVFAMTSGQMWNHIRGPPLVQRSQNGGVAYIHGSSQGQFVLETYFVMAIYAAIVTGMILLIEAGGSEEVLNISKKSKGGKNDGGRRRLFAIVGLGLVAFFFSLILSIFRAKAGGYPYSFLLK